ncbi:MAG: valine--tRNA ligase [Candidatus Marinimicrobia bacterium]|nr:valine--tRNA ligase [Candidatus Neomarinimicrobiota bacterium]
MVELNLMEKTYQPQKEEKKIYAFWKKEGFFTPKIELKKKPFTITLPPPTVTGGLHAGHAMYVVEDIMVRYQRMRGKPSLWLPGFDHASIAVEYLVSQQLAKEGKTKEEVGRKEFLQRAEKFANDSLQYIRDQLKLLGFSLDWTREAYTMDKVRTEAVEEAFHRLYQKGLIYQGERIINWCPRCQTAISDLENVYEEEKGHLYYLKYGPLTLATTRPETIFADVAVAIHPKNKKYQSLVGQLVPLPLTDRKIPVITDQAVDLQFGTGALKITPAHDPLDFEIGERHQLKKLVAIGLDGQLTKLTGKYAGLAVKEGRKKVVDDLKKGKFIEKIEDYTHAIGHCQRCGETTEPNLSKQWFVKAKPLAEKAIQAVKTGQIKIIPRRYTKIYYQWLENIRDWCISRQLWWGHKIPLSGETDILDTWFSSGLWPISTFGWPKKTKDLNYFYPTTVRETAYDILFFWVAREIMLCLEMTGKIPFEIVYLHGLVRDEKGQKFSKTKGIGFDPAEMIEKYGADALRMALVVGNPPGNDLKIEESKVLAYRNFANKIWNASRFVLAYQGKVKKGKKHEDDQWILQELAKTTKKVTNLINRYRFDLAAETIYHFFWHTYCDQYLEMSKKRRDEAQPTLLQVLETSLKLLHPFMPFVTEAVYQRLPDHGKALIIETWP